MAKMKTETQSDQDVSEFSIPQLLSIPLPSTQSFSCSTLGILANTAGSSVLLSSALNFAPRAVLGKEGTTAAFNCTAFSSDGLLIAAGQTGPEAKVIVWHSEGKLASTGEVTAIDGEIQHLSFSNTGKYLAGICLSRNRQMQLVVWDWRLGKEVAKQQLQTEACCLAWADSTTVVTAGSGFLKAWTLTKAQGFAARLQPCQTGSFVLTPRPTNLRSLGGADFVALAAGGQDGSSGLYALTSAGFVGVMQGASRDFDKLVDLKVGQVFTIAASRTYVAVGGSGGQLLVLAARTLIRKLILKPPGSQHPAGAALRCLACGFGRRGETLVAAYSDGRLISWDLRGKVRAVTCTHTAPLVGLRFLSKGHDLRCTSEQGMVVSAGSDSRILAAELPVGASFKSPRTAAQAVQSGMSQAFSRAGQLMTCFSASSCGSFFAAGGSRGALAVEFRADGLVEAVRLNSAAHSSAVSALAFGCSQSGEPLLASADASGCVAIHQLEAFGECLEKAAAIHSSTIAGLWLAAGGRVLVSGCTSGQIAFQQLGRGGQVWRGQAGRGRLRGIVAARGSDVVAVIGEDSWVEAWHCGSKSRLSSFTTPAAFGSLLCGALPCKGAWIAIAHSDFVVRLYELQTGKLMAAASGHMALVVGLEFADPTGMLVSASSEGCVLAWKLPSLPGAEVKEEIPARALVQDLNSTLKAHRPSLDPLLVTAGAEPEAEAKSSPDKKAGVQGKENSPSKRVPRRSSPVRRSLTFHNPGKGLPHRAAREGRGPRARQRSEPLPRKGTDPWEVLKPKRAATIKKVRPIHAETPKPAKERKFLRQDLAIINEQFEALGKDWSKMKNQQPQRWQASKASECGAGMERSNEVAPSSLLRRSLQKKPLSDSELDDPSSEEAHSGVRSSLVRREASWSAEVRPMQTCSGTLPPESCTPDDISRLAIRLSFSAANSSGQAGKKSPAQPSPGFATPTSLVSIDAVQGIKATVAPTTLGVAQGTGRTPAVEKAGTPLTSGFPKPLDGRASEIAKKLGASNASPTTQWPKGSIGAEWRGTSSLNAVSRGTFGLRAQTEREAASLYKVGKRSVEVQSRHAAGGRDSATMASFSFDTPAAGNVQEPVLWQPSDRSVERKRAPLALTESGGRGQPGKGAASSSLAQRRNGSGPVRGSASVISSPEEGAEAGRSSSALSSDEASGPEQGMTPFLSSLEVPHGIDFTPDSIDDEEAEQTTGQRTLSSPKARWDNPFFDSSISPKKPTVKELQLSDIPLDDNPAYDSARGDSTRRRRRQSLARLMLHQQAACGKSAHSEEMQPAEKLLPNDSGPSGVSGWQPCKAHGTEELEQMLGLQQRPPVPTAVLSAIQQPPAPSEAGLPEQQLVKQAEPPFGGRVPWEWEGRAPPSGASLGKQQLVVSHEMHEPEGGADDCETFYSPELLPLSILPATPGEALHSAGSHAVKSASQPLGRASTEALLAERPEGAAWEGDASSQSCSERQESSGDSAARRKKSPVHALWKTMKFWRRQPDFDSPSAQAEHSTKNGAHKLSSRGAARKRLAGVLESATDTEADEPSAAAVVGSPQEQALEEAAGLGGDSTGGAAQGQRDSIFGFEKQQQTAELPRPEHEYLQAMRDLRSSASHFQDLLRELSSAAQQDGSGALPDQSLAARLLRTYTDELAKMQSSGGFA